MIFFLFIVAGVIVLLSLAFLMPAFYYIPKASLAAVIICAVAPMVDYRVVAKMWRIRSEFHLAIVISQVIFIYVRYLNLKQSLPKVLCIRLYRVAKIYKKDVGKND